MISIEDYKKSLAGYKKIAAEKFAGKLSFADNFGPGQFGCEVAKGKEGYCLTAAGFAGGKSRPACFETLEKAVEEIWRNYVDVYDDARKHSATPLLSKEELLERLFLHTDFTSDGKSFHTS